MIKGFIFDFDGLILDTETPEYMGWQVIYQEYGCELPVEKWARCIGTTFDRFDPIVELEALTQKKFVRQEIRQNQRTHAHRFLEGKQPLPGVVELIQEAHGRGIKLAIASSSDLPWVQGHLERLGLLGYFDCLRTRENVTQVKPAPDLFLAALDCLALKSDEAIVFEDSLNGVLAAKAAGIFCVAVPNMITAGMDYDHADMVIPTLSNLIIDDLLDHAAHPAGSNTTLPL